MNDRPTWKIYTKTGWQPYSPALANGRVKTSPDAFARLNSWVVAIDDFHTGERLWPSLAMAAE